MNSGWFAIPGVQDGDRTIDEQLLGLDRLLEMMPGKSILDLGCAEGAISRVCADRGAAIVLGVDYNLPFVETARKIYGDRRELSFCHADLNKGPEACGLAAAEADIVLMLAILHKLKEPAAGLRQWARLAREWIVVRLPIGSEGEFGAKHYPESRCDIRVELPALGFTLDHEEAGPRGELVHYWTRV